jgi:HAD superfamily hydrolase (TIGR01509 family)
MTPLQAIIFDVDGTLAETEEWHREAFNRVFDAFVVPWRWDQDLYRDLLKVTGGKERMLHYARAHDPARLGGIASKVEAMHEAKNALYAELVKTSAGALRPGVRRLVEEARARGLRLAIATTTSRANVVALLSAAWGPQGAEIFSVVVCGEDVARKKPDPEVYTLALRRLGVSPQACVAIEDSRNGLAAASAANIRAIVTPSVYSAHEDFTGAWALARDLDHFEGAPLTVDEIDILSMSNAPFRPRTIPL